MTALAVAVVFGVGGCSDPCEELSKKICGCESTEVAQDSCKQRVSDEASQQPDNTTAQKEICSDKLDTCTCDELADGHLASCGLAPDSSPGS